MQSEFKVYSTVITPFTTDGKIDYPSLVKLIDLLAMNNCDGLFAVCQSSEMFYLSDMEKLELAKYCIRLCNERKMKCVISGHTQDRIEDQIEYLLKAEQLGADSLILVLNRLAGEQESDDKLLDRLSFVMSRLKTRIKLGIYECPYPYKRLLTPQIIDFIIKSGRFNFIKDTCCDIELIKQRLKQLTETGIELFNANAATLVESFIAGAAGYSGIMLNFIPEHFKLLKKYLSKKPIFEGAATSFHLKPARNIGEFITLASVYQYQCYPQNAKYYLMQHGIIATDVVRNGFKKFSSSQHEELKALANFSNRMLAEQSGKICT
jgi:4-hydroxy-tetrahydrodipicolinate synthase